MLFRFNINESTPRMMKIVNGLSFFKFMFAHFYKKKNFRVEPSNFHTHFTVDCVLLNKKRAKKWEISVWIDLMNEDVRWNNNWLSFDKKRCHVAQGPIWSIHTFRTREDSSGVPPSPKRWLCTFFSYFPLFFFSVQPWRILIISYHYP